MSTWRKKIEKARFHSVISMGTKEQRFEVSCRDRTRQGVRRQRVVQEVLITIDGRVFCRCQKPKVHHLPCSHVIAACSVSRLDAASYVSHYFTKEAAAQTWCHEIYGIGILGPFTQQNSHPMLIPDPAMKRGIGRRQTRRIQNGMDESEVGKKKKRCNLCGADGHTYKKCPQLSVPTAAAEAGPSGNPTDGSAPPTRIRRI